MFKGMEKEPNDVGVLIRFHVSLSNLTSKKLFLLLFICLLL